MIEFERLDNCPICGSTQLNNQLVCKDNLKSNESFALVNCIKCGFLFTNPRPTQSTIGFYYDSDKYYSHHTSFSPVGMVYSVIKSFNLKYKIDLLNKLSNGKGNLLDYGCGQGDFLASAKKDGWNIKGVEVDTDARNNSIQKNGNVIAASIDELKGSTFEVISLWHVLEHIHELDNTFKSIKNLLAKDGKILIAVPNYKSYDGQLFKEDWAAYDVPRHLYHFERKTMKDFAVKHKMKIVAEYPLHFDAYYISLLSDLKGSGLGKLWKAYTNGRKSNEEAKKNGEYSSIIYILGK